MITVTIHVHAGAAARIGKSNAGPQRIRLDEEALDKLTSRQRETLARHLEDYGKTPIPRPSVCWGDPLSLHAPPVGEATIPVLASLLNTRYELMRLQEPDAIAAVQQRITEAIRAVPDGVAQDLAEQILADSLSEAEALTLAAARHPLIRAALAQVFQVDDLTGGFGR